MEQHFTHGDSVIHRLDPRIKILIFTAFSILVAVGNRHAAILIGLGFAILLITLARCNILAVLRRLAVVNTFIIFLWFFLPFTYGDTPYFRIWRLTAMREGVDMALKITLKSNAIVIASIALLSTSSLVAIGHALWHLCVPVKLVHIFLFNVRYFHVVLHEYTRLMLDHFEFTLRDAVFSVLAAAILTFIGLAQWTNMLI